MAEFYKREIAKWIVATDDLTLEQEAAYSRVVDMIRLYERPFRMNLRVLGGMWRCNERKAKRLLDELVAAGKLVVEDGFIIDEKAVEDASTLRGLRVERASAGRRGGIESGKSRRKPLENNDTGEAIASTREEKRREESSEDKSSGKTDVSPPPETSQPPDPDKVMFDSGVALLRAAGKPDGQARSLLGRWRKEHGTESVIAALGKAQREGAIDPVSFIEGVFRQAKRKVDADDGSFWWGGREFR